VTDDAVSGGSIDSQSGPAGPVRHPQLLGVRVPPKAEAVVIVLHGGAARGPGLAVSPAQLSVLRMVPVAARIARAGSGRLVVHRLLNSHRGWDTHHTPVMDVAWALDEVRARHGELPVALVGHSLGGRAALLAADQPLVRSVVALNPWVHPSDRVAAPGRQVLVVHGLDDRVTPAARSASLARRMASTSTVGYVAIPGGRHAMLRHGRRFERYAAEFVTATLLGVRAHSKAVRDVLEGAEVVTG
jgi:alpha-beta hydrolase superfamily lysophospholipase